MMKTRLKMNRHKKAPLKLILLKRNPLKKTPLKITDEILSYLLLLLNQSIQNSFIEKKALFISLQNLLNTITQILNHITCKLSNKLTFFCL
ncbi:hypothetical protein FGO68_gene10269 [Halteria grandinella]|uniref:Uncharacterized protein n=1 Tax=Halteria grandinella TaxID=5974 RepID=A0A8J8T107_HALGN|nr:hypothetical protein FGO68_gene10269 [Halteria grandinella]